MSVSLKVGKKDLPRLIIALLFCAAGIILSVLQGFYDSIFWYAGLFLLTVPTVTVNSSDSKLVRVIPEIIYPLFTAYFTIFFMQMINLANHKNIDGERWLYHIMYHYEFTRMFREIPIIIFVYFLLRMFMVPRRFAACFAPLPFLILGLADYYVFEFRGHEILFSDFMSAQTAANVAGNYNFDLLYPVVFLAMPYALFMMVCLRLKGDKPATPAWLRVIIFGVVTAAALAGFVLSLLDWAVENRPQDWADKGSRFNGFLLNFSLSVKTLFVEPPKGYSTAALDELIATEGIDISYKGNADEASNVIVIMNESFMDPRSYLYTYSFFQDPTPYFNSLSSDPNAVMGLAASSVYGGNTPNSEFEFLTGITIGYMPNGAVPYMQYVKDPQYSLAWAMKEMGYYTIAMHPYYSSGWNRTNVYPNFGFDKMMFMDDFTYEQSDLQRDEYMTDAQAYANLIEQIEQAPEDQKVFAFLITVQNHAGYTENLTNFVPTEYFAPGTANGNELALNVYLTCLKQSDDALKDLLEYLSEQDEKYTVMMFGDHQPQFMSVFPNNFAPGVYTSWTIPYMIWTNYDMDPEIKAQYENDTVGITSINYLAIDTLKAAGIELPGYFQLLEKMREELPCINSAGYYSNSLGSFGVYGDPTDAETQKVLDLFQYIQYNLMFDKDSGEFKNSLMTVVGN